MNKIIKYLFLYAFSTEMGNMYLIFKLHIIKCLFPLFWVRVKVLNIPFEQRYFSHTMYMEVSFIG